MVLFNYALKELTAKKHAIIISDGDPSPPSPALLQQFVDEHHVDEPFHKRKRKRHDAEQEAFSRRRPIDERNPKRE